MQVSSTILTDLKEAIITTHDLPRFDPLADLFSDQSSVSFQNDISPGAFKSRIKDYLDLLNKKGKILDFCQLYFANLNEAQKSFPAVMTIAERITLLFVKNNDVWQIAPVHFNCCLIKKNFAFLDRKPIREAFKRMINDKDNSILVLQGQSKAGLSYTRLYLSHLESNFQAFKLIEIDLKNKVSGYATGLIYAAHAAQFISDSISMNLTIDLEKPEQFKIIPFINKLKIHLGNSEEIHLFFIDQFDVPLAEDVFAFITGLAELPLNNFKVLLILSGYSKMSEWGFLLEHSSNKIDIKNGIVTKQDVTDFFESVYNDLVSNFKAIPFSKEEFLNEVKTVVKDDDFIVSSAPGTNVGVIGERLSKWYKDLYEKIKNN